MVLIGGDKMNTLIQCYKDISEDIWYKIDFSNKLKFKFGEVAITSHLLFHLYRHTIKTKNNSIVISESTNESTSGSDLELYVEIKPKKYLYFLIQAKKLYYIGKRSKYTKMSYKVGTCPKCKSQLDILLTYANLNDGIPLYLLYNYSSTFGKKDKEYYGCSFVSAKHIKDNFTDMATILKWKTIPTFDDLHDTTNIHSMLAQPLYKLGYRSLLKMIKKHYPAYKLIDEKNINMDDWLEIKSDVEIIKSGVNVYNDDNYLFAPRHRIIQKLESN